MTPGCGAGLWRYALAAAVALAAALLFLGVELNVSWVMVQPPPVGVHVVHAGERVRPPEPPPPPPSHLPHVLLLPHSAAHHQQPPEAAVPPWLRAYADLHAAVLSGARPPRYLQFTCSVGGLGDRMLGLLSSAFLAIALNRAFVVKCEPPTHAFRLADFLRPALFDWAAAPARASSQSAHRFLGDADAAFWQSTDLPSLFAADVVLIESHVSFYVPATLNPSLPNRFWADFEEATTIALARTLLRALFQPTVALQSHIRGLHSHFAPVTVGLQVRMGDGPAGWGGGGREGGEDLRWFLRCAMTVSLRLLRQAGLYNASRVVRWFLTTDNTALQQNLTAAWAPLVFSSAGPITHTDYSGASAAQHAAALKTIGDLWLLGEVNQTIITNSNFGRIGGYRGPLPPYVWPDRCEHDAATDQVRWPDITHVPNYFLKHRPGATTDWAVFQRAVGAKLPLDPVGGPGWL